MMRYLPEVSESAVDKALAEWQAQYPAMGICALLPEAEKGQVALLQRACANRGVPLVGAIFPALVRDDTFATSGVWLLCFDHMPHVALYENLPADAAGAEHADRDGGEPIRNHPATQRPSQRSRRTGWTRTRPCPGELRDRRPAQDRDDRPGSPAAHPRRRAKQPDGAAGVAR